MLNRCLTCYTHFPANSDFEHAPWGRRLAFDPKQGRLWVLCATCSAWTLVPVESRWEALEELEGKCRGEAKLVKEGENVSLFLYGRVEIVRVGKAPLEEESWWRYGYGLISRASRARSITRRGKVLDLLLLLSLGLPLWGVTDPEHWTKRARRRRFGDVAWRGYSSCPGCGHELWDILFDERRELWLELNSTGRHIRYTCPVCGSGNRDSGHRVSGISADQVARRTLAFENFAGADLSQVNAAAALISEMKGPERLLQRTAFEERALGELNPTALRALEIALNASVEAELLQADVAELDARWREEEQLAAIIDDELTSFIRRKTSNG